MLIACSVMLAAAAWLMLPTAALAASPHMTYAGASTCETCHAPHQAATSAGLFRSWGGLSGEVPTCYSCHDGTGSSTNIKSGPDSFGLTSGHVLESVVDTGAVVDLTNTCSSCHTAHGDYTTRPDLPARQVNGVTVTGPGNAWCLACHNDSNDWYAGKGAYPALSSPARDASGYPVAGTFAGAAVYNDPAKNPHALIPASSGATTRAAGDCLYCHAAHGSASKYDALLGNLAPSTAASVAGDRASGAYASECLTCHGGGSWETSGAADIKQYVNSGAASTDITAAGGHRIKSAGGDLPVDAPLPCYDCHNPHGSSRGNKALLSDALGASLDTGAGPEAVRKACLTCHTTSEGLGWSSVDATYTTPAATSTVEGLNRGGGAPGSGPGGSGQNWLRLKAVPGHSSADSSLSCYDCHGNDYSTAGSSNVHDPGVFGASTHAGTGGSGFISAGMENLDHGLGDGVNASCSDCHTLSLLPLHANACLACHGASAPAAVKAAVTNHDTSCTTCHPDQHSSSPIDAHAALYGNGSSTNRNGCGPAECHGGGCTQCHPASTPTPAPVTTSDVKPSYISTATINLSAVDGVVGSFGIRATYFVLDGASAVAGTQLLVPAPASGNTTHTVSFWSTDWSGNTETPHTVSFGVGHDSIPPVTTSDLIAAKVYVGDTTFTLTPTDANSGIAGTWWQLDSTSGTWTAGTTVPVAQPTSGTAAHTLYWYSRDTAGNTEATQSRAFSVTRGKEFAFTGAPQTFVVPSGITTISVVMNGGSGGRDLYGFGHVGGAGGRVSATITVTPLSTLTVYVAGVGGSAYIDAPGGYPNGGAGKSTDAGGGGGSSSIWLGATELAEAGGGGGAGYNFDGGAGGSQGTAGGGFQTGTVSAFFYAGGGGGGWNRGLGGAAQGSGGTGGTSYIAVGSGTLTAGANTGDGSVTFRY